MSHFIYLQANNRNILLLRFHDTGNAAVRAVTDAEPPVADSGFQYATADHPGGIQYCGAGWCGSAVCRKRRVRFAV